MRALLFLLILWAPEGRASDRYDLFTRVLKSHVREGRVDYRGLKQSRDFAEAIRQFSRTNPASLSSRNEQMAFWINVYNAFTLKLITDNYPVRSINDLHAAPGLVLSVLTGRTVWQRWTFEINGERYTLDRVEHDILRKRYADFRIHAAVNCASRGCPPLRAEAFEPARLDAQLEDQMRVFLRSSKIGSDGTLYVSKIFDWYRSDFETRGPLSGALRPYLPPEAAARLQAGTKIEFLDYDWALNE